MLSVACLSFLYLYKYKPPTPIANPTINRAIDAPANEPKAKKIKKKLDKEILGYYEFFKLKNLKNYSQTVKFCSITAV